jgi:hypothetical protein
VQGGMQRRRQSPERRLLGDRYGPLLVIGRCGVSTVNGSLGLTFGVSAASASCWRRWSSWR